MATVATSLVYGQNAKTAEGLKVGKWVHHYDYGSSAEGAYNVISINKYDSVGESWGDAREVIFRGKKARQRYMGGRRDTLISVQDGLWIGGGSWGGHVESFFIDGIEQWEKAYDAKGQIESYRPKNYVSDTQYAVMYDDGQVTDSSVWFTSSYLNPTTFYYPYGTLLFTQIRTSLYANFIRKPSDTAQFRFVPKQNLSLTKLTSSSKTLSLYDNKLRKIEMPLSLVKGDTFILKVVYLPDRHDSRKSDTVSLTTDITGDKSYKLYVETEAVHIDRYTTDTSFTLSKSKDRNLLINDPGGTLNTIEISDKTNVVYKKVMQREHAFEAKLKVALSQFKPGEYKIYIAGNAQRTYNFRLRIVE